MKYLFDSNAVINFMCDNGNFSQLSANDYFSISFVTYIEISVGYKSKKEKSITDLFLKKVKHYMIDDPIITKTIDIRKAFGLKLPDAVIAATAFVHNLILITSDTNILTKAELMNIEVFDPLKSG